MRTVGRSSTKHTKIKMIKIITGTKFDFEKSSVSVQNYTVFDISTKYVKLRVTRSITV